MEQAEIYRRDALARNKAGAKAIEHLVEDDRSPQQKRKDREKLAQEVADIGRKNKEAAIKAGEAQKVKDLKAQADKAKGEAEKLEAEAKKAAKSTKAA